MKRKKKTLSGIPGSIFKRKTSNKWYIKIFGKTIATGIEGTSEGLEIVKKMHREAYFEYLKMSGKLPDAEPEKVDFQTARANFLNYLLMKQRQKLTIKNYLLFIDRIFTKNIILTEREVEDCFILFRTNNQHLSPTSINIYLRGLQVFVNFCKDKRYIGKLDIYKKYALKSKKKKVVPYQEEEIALIFEFLRQSAGKSIKQRVMDSEFVRYLKVQLLLGGRRKETVELTWESIDFEKKYISFSNKINKEEIDELPLTDELIEIFHEQKLCSKLRLDQEDNKIFRWDVDTLSSLARKLNGIEKKLGIKIPGRCFHGFRKAYSQNLIDKSADPYMLKDLMRHRDIKTTMDSYKEHKLSKMRKVMEDTSTKKD